MSNFQFDVEYIDSGCNREAMLTTADAFYENKRNGKLINVKNRGILNPQRNFFNYPLFEILLAVKNFAPEMHFPRR